MFDFNKLEDRQAAINTIKRYKCGACGFEKTARGANHYGATWSVGHYNTCPQCPPYKKYPEFGGSTVWQCLGKVEELTVEQELEQAGFGHRRARDTDTTMRHEIYRLSDGVQLAEIRADQVEAFLQSPEAKKRGV